MNHGLAIGLSDEHMHHIDREIELLYGKCNPGYRTSKVLSDHIMMEFRFFASKLILISMTKKRRDPKKDENESGESIQDSIDSFILQKREELEAMRRLLESIREENQPSSDPHDQTTRKITNSR